MNTWYFECQQLYEPLDESFAYFLSSSAVEERIAGKKKIINSQCVTNFIEAIMIKTFRQ